jgi:putative isomerase
MNFDITKVPFSRYESYLAFSILPKNNEREAGLYLRSLRGPATGGRPMQEILFMELLSDNAAIPFGATANPQQLRLSSGNSRQAEACFEAADSVRFRLHKISIRFSMPTGAYDYIIPHTDGKWMLTVNTACETKLMVTPLKGRMEVDAPWQAENCENISIIFHPDADGACEFAIDEFTVEWDGRAHTKTFDECLTHAKQEFENWMKDMPRVPARYAETRELACYVMWSCVVAPEGHLTRPAVFASKNGMIGAWSWDHCFHALSLAEAHPQLAWDQIIVLFDQQDVTGVMPDLINDRLVSWSFCKPPVHGWILNRLARNSELMTNKRLNEIYEPLARWTNWWITQRDDDGDGIPQCNHGNDSGWDNSTVFAVRPPIESPEISAYLVLQMDFLAQAADRLDKKDEASQWLIRADDLTKNLLAHFWRGDHFVAVESFPHTDIEAESLQLYLPLIMGKRLPEDVRAHLLRGLKQPERFVTAHGLATESVSSPHYRSRGYWRGPIWAAPTLIMIDGLIACDEIEFANDIRQRFVDLVAQNGMAENFDAQTGQGYHDFHFSWTAGIWLTLASEVFKEENLLTTKGH